MGVINYNTEVSCPIPPARIFKAYILDADNLLPKLVPQAIKKYELLEGDGGAGSYKQIYFGEAIQFKGVKHRINELDKENFIYSYSVIEGDGLMGLLDSVTYVLKFEASPDGGSIYKNSSTYVVKDDFAAQFNEEQVKTNSEAALGVFKAVEAYLLANPDAYN